MKVDASMIAVRRMTAHDPAALARAFAHVGKTLAQFEAYWRENVGGLRATLVAERGNDIVGYTNVIWRSKYAPFREARIPEISDMNVIVSLRRRGIGTRMITAAENLAHQRGSRVIGIGVGVTPDYAIAQRLYPRLGYVPDGTGIHRDEWGGCIYLTKRLDVQAGEENE